MQVLLVEVAEAEALTAASSVVSAKADWNPAAASPPAATVPLVTAMTRRRLIDVSLWFPVMIDNVETERVSRTRRT